MAIRFKNVLMMLPGANGVSLQLAQNYVGKGEIKDDIDLALKGMVEDILAQHYPHLRWNLFLVTLALVLRIVSGQTGEHGNNVTEIMERETRLDGEMYLWLENMEASHVSRVILSNKGNVLFRLQNVELRNGLSGVQPFAPYLQDNITKHETDLSSVKIPSSLDMIAQKKEKDVETRLCQGCPAGWHYVINGDEHHCYRVLRDIPRNWIESRDACRQANGYLAEITSQAENDAVLKYLRDYEDVDCWIGLNDRETEDQFEWSKSKTKLGGFSDWETIYSREPNNGVPHWGEEDCVFLYARALSVNRKWNDLNCKDNSEANIPLYALCEYDFEDFAVKDCVYEDEFFRYCKVGVKPGTTMSEGSVAQTCREVGMEAVCSGNQRCKYSSSDCVVTLLSTKCFAPMYSLFKRICSGRQPRECPALKGVFSHMTGLSGGECGVVGNTWCAKGNDFTAQNNSHYFAYCAEEKG
eukprot:GFUD01067085.1.p2 GENE.GFUD01067085.1~~GFUD01067085.1.p2  ORF type:complete len:468 (+),score=85.48 GFUD01067085.1:907-2310(+)